MNQRTAKKLRKIAKEFTQKNGEQYLKEILAYSFKARLRYAWFVVTHSNNEQKAKDKIWKQRRKVNEK